MSDQVAVRVVFPDGTSQTWETGKQVILPDGVAPLSASMLGDIVGMMTAAGLLIPRDHRATLFDSIVPRDALQEALLGTLAFLEATHSRIVGDAE